MEAVGEREARKNEPLRDSLPVLQEIGKHEAIGNEPNSENSEELAFLGSSTCFHGTMVTKIGPICHDLSIGVSKIRPI